MESRTCDTVSDVQSLDEDKKLPDTKESFCEDLQSAFCNFRGHVMNIFLDFDVLLTVHLSIFILEFNQLDAQNLFYSKFYFTPLHVSSTCAHHQKIKIALYSLWYHHMGTAVAQWIRCCATNRKVAGSIPAGVIGIFH